MDHRIAVVVLETLGPGEAANVAALLTGQIGRGNPIYFNADVALDAEGVWHAAPIFSVVLLKAKNASQLSKLARESLTSTICFSRLGQTFHNAFPEYAKKLAELSTEAAGLVGVAVYGDDQLVRAATRKFSLLK